MERFACQGTNIKQSSPSGTMRKLQINNWSPNPQLQQSQPTLMRLQRY